MLSLQGPEGAVVRGSDKRGGALHVFVEPYWTAESVHTCYRKLHDHLHRRRDRRQRLSGFQIVHPYGMSLTQTEARMKSSSYLRTAIAGLFILTVVSFEMLAHASAQAPCLAISNVNVQ